MNDSYFLNQLETKIIHFNNEKSVGIILKETGKYIIAAHTLKIPEDMKFEEYKKCVYNDYQVIPKVAVKKIENIYTIKHLK